MPLNPENVSNFERSREELETQLQGLAAALQELTSEQLAHELRQIDLESHLKTLAERLQCIDSKRQSLMADVRAAEAQKQALEDSHQATEADCS